jgi:hypothetical protein
MRQGHLGIPAPPLMPGLHRKLRCVYCKKFVTAYDELPAHEAQCDARFVMKRLWRVQYERAKAKERKEAGLAAGEPVSHRGAVTAAAAWAQPSTARRTGSRRR